ncbi:MULTISPECIES: CHAT domain-containing protein [Azospirillum]|uniref:CHAT domain-containing protein n=1 Tax=Azospirillum brasilense TaxID=192 RepID=A0ABU4PGD7_AZOBR|nr:MULTISPECIES: CHAT domain-containing protein [Azospirillum]ALJ39378.1 hypothetical protein AMK58_28135 [Azospirillum brasilense]MDX5955841.1 CHAT domain-containing protein [Azospirillum brasilense]
MTERLPAIGRAIADFLNQGNGWLDGCLRNGNGPVVLDILAPDRPDEREAALLDVPWEVLAPGGFLLAEDAVRLFLVARRLGEAGAAEPPVHGDIAALFMAAEVEGQDALDYEQEEIAFLDATRGLGAHLAVEESGSLDGLRLRLRQTARWDVLHLTGHGEVDRQGPYLALETPEGRLDRVDPGKLCAALGDDARRPHLVFLSACRTAEQADGGAGSFVQALIQAGVPNALGWDGSVHDLEATRFAALFYGELAGGRSVAHAAAAARLGVLQDHRADPQRGAHWHLARVWLGPRGGGALCDPALPTRPFRERRDKAYLDKARERVPVATPEQFVGRRRPIQAALRAWAEGKAGVLVQGMGNLGKSSLAERIASRLDTHRVAVVFERYDAHAVLLALVDALPEGEQKPTLAAHEQDVLRDPAALKLVLQGLLKGPFSGHAGTRPLLLIVDDLERRLAEPKPDEPATPFRTPEDAAVMASVVGAFRDAGRATKSRLLITSRYTFALTDARGTDLAASLAVVGLPPMQAAERAKQMRAAARLRGKERAAGDDPDLDRLEGRIKAVAGGNPGLQEILTRPLLELADRAAGVAAAERAVAAVQGYLDSGAVPAEESTAHEFFRRLSLEAFRAMLTPTEARQLAAATLFELPVPRAVLEAAGRAAGIAAPEPAVDRLQGLGLLDRYGGAGMDSAVNPLARPLAAALSEADRAHLAAAVVGPLHAAWTDEDGDLPVHPRAVELARLALLAGGPPEILNAAALMGGLFLFHRAHMTEAAWQLVSQALDLLDRAGAAPDLHLLRLGVQCAERLGQGGDQDALLARAVSLSGTDPRADAMVLSDQASRLIQVGRIGEAEVLLRDAVQRFEALDDVYSRAVTLSQIADILEGRGETKEALRIRREEELPVFERLGDMRARAVTLGRIADILTTRGETDEALRIRREEQLPVYERLGEVHAQAVTLGRIADILTTRGETDEALRIRREKELPVYEQLSDVHSRAVTLGQIAEILANRGETEEALRILREEVVPITDRMDDVKGRAVTLGKIANILARRGEFDEALRIHLEERLPVAQRMQDIDSLAHIRFSCAEIRLRGRLEKREVETIIEELTESFALFDQLERVDAIGAVGALFGQVLAMAGRTDEALRVLDEAAAAFAKIQHDQGVEHVRAIQAAIRKAKS